MEPRIKATNITLTPEVVDYLDKRLKALEKLIDPEETAVQCDVEVGKTTRHHQSGDVYRAEINLQTKGKLYRASAERETLHEAIDDVKREMLAQLRRDKRKYLSFIRKSGVHFKKIAQSMGERGMRFTDYIRRRKR